MMIDDDESSLSSHQEARWLLFKALEQLDFPGGQEGPGCCDMPSELLKAPILYEVSV